MNPWIKQENDQLKEFQARARVSIELFPPLAERFNELAILTKEKLILLKHMEKGRVAMAKEARRRKKIRLARAKAA